MRRSRVLVVIVAMVFAACTTGGEVTTSTTTPGDLDGPVTTSTTPPPPAPVPSTSTSTSTSTSANASDPGTPASAACLVGVWELESQRFLDQLGTVFPTEFPGPAIRHIGGTFQIELEADGSLSGQRQGWTLAIGAGDGRLVYSIDAEDSGTYVVDEPASTLSVTLAPASAPAVTTQVQVDGALETLEVGPSVFELPEDVRNPSGAFSCTGGGLQVTTSRGVVLEFIRR